MIEFPASMINIEPQTWEEFKKFFDGTFKELALQCDVDSIRYCCFLIDGIIIYQYNIWKDSNSPFCQNSAQNEIDKQDFLDNHLKHINMLSSAALIKKEINGPNTSIDGPDPISFSENEFKKSDYILEKGGHLQGVLYDIINCQLGDYASIAVINPDSCGLLHEAAEPGATTAVLGTLINQYDPNTGCEFIEFWSNNESELYEVHKVVSIDEENQIVTFENGLINEMNTTARIKSRIKCFHFVRGSTGTDGGIRILGTYHTSCENVLELSGKIPEGYILSLRVKSSSVVGNRTLGINYKIRWK